MNGPRPVPADRGGRLRRLRGWLADFLAAHPKVPIPTHGSTICVVPGGSEADERAAVGRIADLIGSPVSDSGEWAALMSYGEAVNL